MHGNVQVQQARYTHSREVSAELCCKPSRIFTKPQPSILVADMLLGMSKNMYVCSLLQGLQACVPRQALAEINSELHATFQVDEPYDMSHGMDIPEA